MNNLFFEEVKFGIVEIATCPQLTFRIASHLDRGPIINLINIVASERKYLQTEQYNSTPIWEQLLSIGFNPDDGMLLGVLEDNNEIIGYARISPDLEQSPCKNIGNIGIALLPQYRSRGFGAKILDTLIQYAFLISYQVLTANILETNIRSRKLFSKYGFQEKSFHKKYVIFLEAYANEICYELKLQAVREHNYAISNQQKPDQPQ